VYIRLPLIPVVSNVIASINALAMTLAKTLRLRLSKTFYTMSQKKSAAFIFCRAVPVRAVMLQFLHQCVYRSFLHQTRCVLQTMQYLPQRETSKHEVQHNLTRCCKFILLQCEITTEKYTKIARKLTVSVKSRCFVCIKFHRKQVRFVVLNHYTQKSNMYDKELFKDYEIL